METEKEKVVKKINKKLVNYDINNYYCEQDKEDLIIKDKNTIDNYIFKFNNFDSNLLEINGDIVCSLFTQKKEDIIYELCNMPNCLLANSKSIIEICKEKLDRYFVDNILLSFKNKYDDYHFYRNYNDVYICIKFSLPVIEYIKINNEWKINILDRIFDYDDNKILELKKISKELLNQLNSKRKE